MKSRKAPTQSRMVYSYELFLQFPRDILNPTVGCVISAVSTRRELDSGPIEILSGLPLSLCGHAIFSGFVPATGRRRGHGQRTAGGSDHFNLLLAWAMALPGDREEAGPRWGPLSRQPTRSCSVNDVEHCFKMWVRFAKTSLSQQEERSLSFRF